MQGPKRKMVQAVLYEALAVVCISPAFAYFFDGGLIHSTTLSVVISLFAVTWNMAFNYAFEWWEAKQIQRERTLSRRIAHAVGFEGGLTILLLPVVSYWLSISWSQALIANLALFAFFFCYSFVFQWMFDKLFGVPNSAKPHSPIPIPNEVCER